MFCFCRRWVPVFVTSCLCCLFDNDASSWDCIASVEEVDNGSGTTWNEGAELELSNFRFLPLLGGDEQIDGTPQDNRYPGRGVNTGHPATDPRSRMTERLAVRHSVDWSPLVCSDAAVCALR
jgi:hypothetical protein